MIDKDERNEAVRMYGTVRNRKRLDNRFLPGIDRFSGIILKDLKPPPPITPIGTEATEMGVENETVTSAIKEDVHYGTAEAEYYSFEEHINFFIQKFRQWRESFNIPNDNTQR